MRDVDLLFSQWRSYLSSRGYSTELVWLPYEAIVFRDRLYCRIVEPPLADFEIAKAIELLGQNDPGVFILLGCSTKCSFVSLLMDPFGTDDEEFLKEQNFHFFTSRYVDRIQVVESKLHWAWLKHILDHRLSSLDYAFSLKQARPS
jgi:hypothetical protein